MTTAITEYTATEAALAELRNKYAKAVFNVSTTKGLDEAKQARAELRGYRTSLEDKRVEIKAPALERCRLIDSEAKRITAELRTLEEPIDDQIKAEETRKEQERAAKIAAEQKRVEEIQARIEAIRQLPVKAGGKTAAQVQVILDEALAIQVSADFAEFQANAQAALTASVQALRGILAERLVALAEQEQIRKDREELDRRRKEDEQRQTAERERIAEEELQAKAKRAEEDRLARAAREEEDRKARETREAELRKQEAELKARREAQAKEEREAAEKRRAEEERIARENAELERRRKAEAEADAARVRAAERAKRKRPSRAEIIKLVSGHFDVENDKAEGWLREIFAGKETA